MKNIFVAILLIFPLMLSAQWDEVTFSKKGGVYDIPFMLTLQCNNPSHRICYSLNGATPTASSHLYTQPLLVNRLLYSSSCFYKQKTTPPGEEQFVPDSIFRAVVIRAAVFDVAGNRISPVVTNSYFIKSLGCNFSGLPVVSLCADSVDLYDEELGIMVPGVNLDSANMQWSGNYYMTGRAWERLCNVEYYDDGNRGFNQQAGLRTHGGNGRRFQQKGLKIYAREEYGKKRFTYPIFDNLDISSFKHLALKPFVAAWTSAGVQDYLSYLIARNLNLDVLAERPVVLFLNGEYWGIYFIHEKADERYVEDHYQVDPDLCNIIGSWTGLVESGDGSSFIRLMQSLETADLSDSVQYQQIANKIDIPDFIDYQILEIFIKNADWPANNMRCWQVPGTKWRWIFFDGDAGFHKPNGYVFTNAIDEGSREWPSNAQSTLLFRQLLQNNDFKSRFVERYNELSDKQFSYHTTGSYLEKGVNMIKNEIARQSFRFGNPANNSVWKNDIKKIDLFLRSRPQVMMDSVKLFFNIPDNPVILSSDLWIYPNPASDHFTIQMKAETFGVTRVLIKDMTGRICYDRMVFYAEGENRIPVSCNLRSGTYVISVGKVSKKLVIAR